jgi:sulfatase modifying factor 1
VSARVSGLLAGLALAGVASSLALAAKPATPRPAEVWTRLELVENSAEGPASDRCAVETTVRKESGARWRLFYGEARADSASGWAAIRSSSGCRLSAPEIATSAPKNDASSWGLSGTPYLVVDLAIAKASVSGAEVILDATIVTRKLTGFGPEGAPAYESATGTRTIRVTGDTSAVVPVLIASSKETDEFRVRELLLKLNARVPGSSPAVQYGEIAVTADVPRARIFLDGGPVGRTSAAGPVVLGAVRTGDREVVVQDASGREARTVTRVGKGKRSAVALTVLKPSGPAADGLRPLGTNPQGGEEFWRERDGAVVVRIPAGAFQMGSPDGQGDASERPMHAVRVHGILMDKTEVTWGQYKLFQAVSGKSIAKPPIWGTPEAMPVSGIAWDDARAYCEWVGGRLPTEAEWEREARGDAGWTYPWGNTFEPWRCNTRDGGPHAPGEAGAWPDCVSQHGVLDLAGSVAEWCSDFYKSGYDAGDAPVEDPPGPAAGTTRSVRGGNWMSASFSVRGVSRIGVEAAWNGPMQGFRCVQEDRATPAP